MPSPRLRSLLRAWGSRSTVARTRGPRRASRRGWSSQVLALETLESRELLASDLVISEFMASNANQLADDTGNFSDWIEIHNTTASTVQLGNWFLTNDATNLSKWRFPATSLAPNGYIVVFASGLNHTTAGFPLHTSFKLSAGGDYLALVRPDGATIASEFTPSFPAQITDVSYGLTPGTISLVGPSNNAKVKVPSSAVDPGPTWNTPGFADAAWQSGTNGVGYETLTPAPAAPIAYWTFDDSTADLIKPGRPLDLKGATFSPSIPPATATGKSLSFNGSGQYAVADLNVSEDSYTVAFWFKTTNPNVGLYSVTLGPQGVSGNDRHLYLTSGNIAARLYNNQVISSTGKNYADGQWHYVSHVYNRNTIGQRVYVDGQQVASGNKTFSDFTTQTQIHVGYSSDAATPFFAGQLDDLAIWSSALTQAQVQALYAGAAPQSPSYAAEIGADVRVPMFGVNATVLQRLPFNVDDPAALQANPLILRAKYDDGFVAYLNGTKIAERNAPAAPAWNAAATAANPDRRALAYEEIDVSAFRNLLLAGANVLAIQGLNSAAADNDFLVKAELVSLDWNVTSENFYAVPSPGVFNSGSVVLQVADTKFSHDRGFYSEAFDLTITTQTPGATIRYTLDGSMPTDSTGLVYTGPIHISRTVVVRAAAFKPGYTPTNVDSESYLFLDQVIRQGKTIPGFPTTFGSVGADYEMDQRIVNDAQYASKIIDALRAVPTMSISLKPGDFLGANGIYSNPTQEGPTWERPSSIELINPDGSTAFQIDAGLQMHGGYSRTPEATKKHSFNLKFKGAYGAPKLNYPFFGDAGPDSFDTIVLRAGFNDSWPAAGSITTYLADYLTNQLQLGAGWLSTQQSFVHLYINGAYWGLYNPTEASDATFMADHLGGNKEDYDTIFTAQLHDGDASSWNQVLSMAGAGLQTSAAYDAFVNLVDIPNFIDYFIINIYGGNWDWPMNNWHAGRQRVPGAKWQFFTHDSEGTLDDLNRNRFTYVSWGPFNTTNHLGWLYERLRANPEFRVAFGDRVQKLMFNGGVLTPDRVRAVFDAEAAKIKLPLIAESARWGDNNGFNTVNGTWQPRVDYLDNTFFPQRTAKVIPQFQAVAQGVFPTLAAPLFSAHGGYITPGQNVTLAATAGATIYYTTDGSDPRLVGGAVSPTALVYAGPIALSGTTTIRTRALNGTNWSALDEATFAINTSGLRVTEIMFNPVPPAPGSPYTADDFTYVELQNTTAASLDVNGVHFANGIQYVFSAQSIPAGGRVVLVKNPAAFATRYPGVTIGGTFMGALNADGERLRLEDAINQPIVDFSYQDQWYDIADGGGFSLVIVNPLAAANTWGLKESWRPSQYLAGSPGAGDIGVIPGSVIINELLADGTGAQGDWLELRNTTAAPIDISGWYVSNDPSLLQKYKFPAGTILPAGGLLTITEAADFGLAGNPAALVPFGFSRLGGSVLIASSAPDGAPAGYRDDKTYGAVAPDVSLGPYVKSAGGSDFVPLAALTLGAANAAPLVGPIVLNEIMYNPPTGGDEYIELRNTSGAAVSLFDPAHPANTWRLTSGVSFAFPAGQTLAAGGYALVVPIAPAAFRAKYAIPDAIPIYGPYTGSLDNAGELVEISKPAAPDAFAFVPYVVVDKVRYDNVAPWPELADGLGPSIIRANPGLYGNDVANWTAGFPGGTPGALNIPLDSTPPSVPTGVTANLAHVTLANISWNASSDPDTGISGYKVYRNGQLLATTQALSYVDMTLKPGHNDYQIVAINGHGVETAKSVAAGTDALGIVFINDTAVNKIAVTVSEPLTSSVATQVANYALSAGGTTVAITGASLSSDARTVTLTTANLLPGTTYRLVLGGNLSGTSGRKSAPGAQAFFTAGAGTGLKGEYFNNDDFTAPAVTRTDATVDFNWAAGSPDGSIGPDSFSARWTGQVKATTTDLYTFYVASDQAARLWVNGQLLIDNWSAHTLTEDFGAISLTGGQKYDLRLEYREDAGAAEVHLRWSSSTIAKQIIPVAQLYAAPTLQIGDQSVVGSVNINGQLYAAVNLTAPSSSALTVAYATSDGTALAGSDYLAASGTITFAPGLSVQLIPITIVGDTSLQPAQSFLIDLSNPTGGVPLVDSQAVMTILPAPSITISDPTVNEGDAGLGFVDFTVSLTAPSSQTVTAAYAANAITAAVNSDFFAVSGTLTFAPGVATNNIRVIVPADLLDEIDETFSIDLSNVVNAFLQKNQGIATIIDNDPAPSLSVADVTVNEGNAGTTNAVFNVTLSAASGRTVLVPYAVNSGTAMSGLDFAANSGTLTFLSGATVQKITVAVIADTAPEADESYTVDLINPVGATLADGQAIGNISNDDPAPWLVNSTADSGPGTLRQAILDNNAAAIAKPIVIGLSGTQSLALASPLPAATKPLVLDLPTGLELQIGDAASTLGSFSQLTKTGGGTLQLAGPFAPGVPATLVVNAGLLKLLSDAGPQLTLTLTGGGTVDFLATQHLASLSISDSAQARLTSGGAKRLVVGGLALSGAGKLDLADNDLIVRATAATRDAVLADVTAKIMKSPGITSSAALADSSGLTTLGVLLNRNRLGQPLLNTFAGEVVDSDTVLVKYTYFGDANLSGDVDGTDYALADNGFNLELGGWMNGDFDYSGSVNGTDYALLDNAYNFQGGPLAAGGLAPAGLVAAAPSGNPAAAAGAISHPDLAELGRLAVADPAQDLAPLIVEDQINLNKRRFR